MGICFDYYLITVGIIHPWILTFFKSWYKNCVFNFTNHKKKRRFHQVSSLSSLLILVQLWSCSYHQSILHLLPLLFISSYWLNKRASIFLELSWNSWKSEPTIFRGTLMWNNVNFSKFQNFVPSWHEKYVFNEIIKHLEWKKFSTDLIKFPSKSLDLSAFHILIIEVFFQHLGALNENIFHWFIKCQGQFFAISNF